MRLSVCLIFFVSFSAYLTASAQERQTHLWSSTACGLCRSTILYPGWYSDGAGLFAEGISGTATGAYVAVSIMKGNLVVALGVSAARDHPLVVNPREAVTLETDSAAHMILYPLAEPARGFHKNDLPVTNQFKGVVSLEAAKPGWGFLFFPIDRDAAHITVVINIGNETLRFPFARDPSLPARFGDPAKFSLPIKPQHVEAPALAASGMPQTSPVVNTKVHEKATKESTSMKIPVAAPSSIVSAGPVESCEKNVSFAVAEGGQVVSRAPRFTDKWIAKNQKKYHGLCFSQSPNAKAANFVLVFSTSRSAFDGIYPTIRTNTSTTTTPISGQGTVTDSYGGMWNYTYSGTATTTTTTTSHVTLPYKDTTNTIYAYAYDHVGRLVSQRQRAITTRQGGDAASSLGVNLGALLFSIHLRDRLLNDVISDVTRYE